MSLSHTEPHFHAWKKQGTFIACFTHRKDAEYAAGPDGFVRPYVPPSYVAADRAAYHEMAKLPVKKP